MEEKRSGQKRSFAGTIHYIQAEGLKRNEFITHGAIAEKLGISNDLFRHFYISDQLSRETMVPIAIFQQLDEAYKDLLQGRQITQIWMTDTIYPPDPSISKGARVGIVGDFDPASYTHKATTNALVHAGAALRLTMSTDWIPTDQIIRRFRSIIQRYDAFWIAPGSPYKDFNGVLKLINHARRNHVPVLGTCGGFQHMVIEFARNVLRISDAQHAEYDPYASKLVINPLSCPMAGKALEISITDKSSQAYRLLGEHIIENYYCNFGLNPAYQDQLHHNGFRIAGSDSMNEARILELEGHPFFIATLFVPQVKSTPDEPHPLALGLLRAMVNKPA
ncbi:CTP synthase C-terminal region-related (seleno)protein [Chitinophaga vietnamensis]|uniref:CTP synthase C-terminal region-related (seleno)protein n=1 Tax=Chitinophaga vietnamensis TaxID=2593957 RepID=UPI001178AA5A|nr:hypothetical protein [Chitinophaga vietnamensis]